MKMSRIEVCAMLKSMIEANVPAANWRATIENASELFQEYGGPVGAAPAVAAPAGAAAPAAPLTPWTGTVTITSIERKAASNGNPFASMEITGCEVGRFVKAWDAVYHQVSNMQPGTVCEMVIQPKPNAKDPSRPFLNLTSIKLAPQASTLTANDDIPF